MGNNTTFTLDQALAVQQALRRSLSLKEEVFPVEAFVGMISDEIEQSRKDGHDDQTIVDLVKQITGKTISADDIQQFYAAAEQRYGRSE